MNFNAVFENTRTFDYANLDYPNDRIFPLLDVYFIYLTNISNFWSNYEKI